MRSLVLGYRTIDAVGDRSIVRDHVLVIGEDKSVGYLLDKLCEIKGHNMSDLRILGEHIEGGAT